MGKKKKIGKLNRLVALALVIALLLTGAANFASTNNKEKEPTDTVYAAETDALDGLPGVKFSQLAASAKPNGMLLIGAYLIYDQYLTEPIYQLGLDSMTTYNQPIMYYKSAMAGGKWIDLSSASEFTDLRGKTGDAVLESELADYKVCAIVYSDGVMSSLGAGANNSNDINLFNLSDPYDIMNLSELAPLKLLYGGITDGVDIKWGETISDTLEDTDARTDQLYEKIWTARLIDTPLDGDAAGKASMEVMGKPKTDVTDAMDKSVNNLINAYSYYRKQGNKQYMQTVVEAMAQADYTRRAEVFYILAFNGAGKVYDYIQNKQYDKLMTAEQFAEKYMISNWGPNWYVNDKWKKTIEKAVQDADNHKQWVRYDQGKVYNNLYKTYYELGYKIDVGEATGMTTPVGLSGYRDLTDLFMRYTGPQIPTSENNRSYGGTLIATGVIYGSHGAVAAVLDKSRSKYKEIADIMCITNQINGKKYYDICDVAHDYVWALDQAGDRLADVKYWADQGNYMMAFNNYMSLMQRIGTTQNGGRDWTNDIYIVPGSGRLNALLQRLETGDDLSDEMLSAYSTDAEYTEALKTAIQACEESYYDYTNRLIGDSDNLLGKAQYQTMQYLINNASTSVSSAYDTKVVEYTALRNIANDIIAEKKNELTILERDLLPQGEQNYLKGIAASPSALYNSAVSEGQPEEVQKKYLRAQKAELDGVLSEYEYYISQRLKRLPVASRIPYIDDLLQKAEGYRSRVTQTAFKTQASASVQEFIDWLNDLKKKALGGSTGSSALDQLKAQKAALEDAYMDALDNGDTDAADEYKKMIDDLASKIMDLQDSALDDFMNSDVAGASDAASLLDGTPAGLADELRKKAAAKIKDGDLADMEPILSGLGDLGGEDALNYLEPLLKDAGASNTLMNHLKKAMDTAKASPLNPANRDGTNSSGEGDFDGSDGNGGRGGSDGDTTIDSDRNGNGGHDGDGRDQNWDEGDDGRNKIDTDGYGDRNDKQYDPYNDAIADGMGDDFDNLDDADKAGSAIGLAQYGFGNGDPTAKQLAMLLLDELLKEGNPFIYQKYWDETKHEYVNMSAIDRCRDYTNFRYVMKSGMDTMDQVKGSASYMFSVGNSTVVKSDESRENITDKIESQTDITIDATETKTYPYIVKEDSEHYLSVSCYYIPDTIYAVLIPEDVSPKIEELLGALEAAAEEE